jgi:hypothetical protein
MSNAEIKEPDCSLLVVADEGSDGDMLVSIEAQSFGFQGSAGGHVLGSEWRRFIAQLQLLEDTRKGRATFSSAYPGEFELRFSSVDSQGHLGVTGVLRDRKSVDEWRQQSLEFAFEFDPSKLAVFLASLKEAQQTAATDRAERRRSG